MRTWLNSIANKAEKLAGSFYGFSPTTMRLAHPRAEAELLVSEFMANLICSPEFEGLSMTQQDYVRVRVNSYLINHIPKSGEVLVFYGVGGLSDLAYQTEKVGRKSNGFLHQCGR